MWPINSGWEIDVRGMSHFHSVTGNIEVTGSRTDTTPLYRMESCDKFKAGKGACGGPDCEGCNAHGGEVGAALSSRCLSDGASNVHKPWGGQARAGMVQQGKWRGSADDSECSNRFEEMSFWEQNGKWIDWPWLKLQRSSPGGAAFMPDAWLGSVCTMKINFNFNLALINLGKHGSNCTIISDIGPHHPTLASFPTLHPALHPRGRKQESGSKERVGSMAPTAPSFRILEFQWTTSPNLSILSHSPPGSPPLWSKVGVWVERESGKHGSNCTMRHHFGFWTPSPDLGILSHSPPGSPPLWSNAGVWVERESGKHGSNCTIISDFIPSHSPPGSPPLWSKVGVWVEREWEAWLQLHHHFLFNFSGPHCQTLASLPSLHPVLHPHGQKRESGSKERVGSMAPTAPSFRILEVQWTPSSCDLCLGSKGSRSLQPAKLRLLFGFWEIKVATWPVATSVWVLGDKSCNLASCDLCLGFGR
ncbi:hypothetical protein DFH08DRAFT_822890 [Mycena albidolilacea]|uniref:Uncharacterized protein n=1 Tax=Mycena albidolilacea TaxID=1033008 RepID=A0AAD7EBQ9_9AGAR|nr:hypothetical protein DFH08DRAFT_822890 [Mycena albidolilacea]